TWPVAASLGALALFAFVHLTRFYLVACQKPDVITEGLSNGLEYRLDEGWGDFNSGLESFLGLRRASQNRHSMGLIFFGLMDVVAIVFRVDRLMRSIDVPSYNRLTLSLHLLVIVLLLLPCTGGGGTAAPTPARPVPPVSSPP